MKQITVACRKRDEKCFTIQKYSNHESWNVVGGTATSGVHATRYLRKTSPDIGKLSLLAKFLFDNCPECVFGNYPAFRVDDRCRVFNGKTQADIMRDAAKTGWCNGIRYQSPDEALANAEKFIRCYDLENDLAKIDDWHFAIIEPEQTDEEYWNMTAGDMIDAGATLVRVGGKEWRS